MFRVSPETAASAATFNARSKQARPGPSQSDGFSALVDSNAPDSQRDTPAPDTQPQRLDGGDTSPKTDNRADTRADNSADNGKKTLKSSKSDTQSDSEPKAGTDAKANSTAEAKSGAKSDSKTAAKADDADAKAGQASDDDVEPTPASSSTTGTSSNSTAGLASNFQTFLTLLTTQLKNQNPLDLLDTNQFTSQLVQFAQVEQQLKANDQLTSLVALQKTAQSTQALGFVGSTIAVDGSTVAFNGRHGI